MTGTLAAIFLASWLIRYDAWCFPVVYDGGPLPRPAPLYPSLYVCPGAWPR